MRDSAGQLTAWRNRPNSAIRHCLSHLCLKTEKAVKKLHLLKVGIVLKADIMH